MSATRDKFIKIFNQPDYKMLIETNDYLQIIEEFLLSDNIDVDQFQVNADFLRLGYVGMSMYSGPFEASDSVTNFAAMTDRPPVYPNWFLAAYPDVVTSVTSLFRNNRNLIYTITGTTEIFFENRDNFDNGKFRPKILRSLIHFYSMNSKGGLECTKSPAKNQTVSGSIMGDSLIPKDLQVEMLNQEAQVQFSSNNFDLALEKLSQSIKIAPKARTYFSRGEIYFKISNYKSAYDDFSSAINLDREFAVAYVGRGVIQYKVFQKKSDALRDFRTASDLGSEDAKTLLIQLY